jgi:ribonucleotide monophosphatase NagD (HAD superfamily)
MAEPHPRLIALGMTRYWRAADGLRLDTAPFVVALQHATGIAPVVLGKPARPFFAAALGKLGAEAAETPMIGDDIRRDIGGAQGAGIRGLLVRSDKFRPQDLRGEIQPDGVIDSIANLPAWWIENLACC